MKETIRVDFHLHSECSDGFFSPAVLATRLSAAGVRFAALTDHHNVDGQEVFQETFSRLGGIVITGLELFTTFEDIEVHLLAYGFELNNAAIKDLLPVRCELETAIETIHEAGGLAVIAHPLATFGTIDKFADKLPQLKSLGVDGIEAIYGNDEKVKREQLISLAEEHSLAITGGSDFHGPSPSNPSVAGVPMERSHWERFRQALLKSGVSLTSEPTLPALYDRPKRGRLDWQWFLICILLPAFVAVVHMVAVIFGLLLPAFEENLLARKRDTIRELTNSTWSILRDYEVQERKGELSRKQAQAAAIDLVRHLRYGKEGKDYFWITDMQPRMVMHPYRSDLEGKDLSDFLDPNGVRPFVQFVKTVTENGTGYVDYVWQWKDDPRRLEAKESYVRAFKPWGWVVGTGLYLDDEMKEIEAIESKLIHLAVVIILVIGVLLTYVVMQSLRIERQRSKAVFDLQESHERYRALVEASTEGTLMFVGQRCAYANQALLDMIGCRQEELTLLDMTDVFLPGGQEVQQLFAGDQTEMQFESKIKRRDGSHFDCLIAATSVTVAETRGLILVIRDLSRHKEMEAQLGESLDKYEALAEGIDIGVFRANSGRPCEIVEKNTAARNILGNYTDLESIFILEEERERFLSSVLEKGAVKNLHMRLQLPQGPSTIKISAVSVCDDDGEVKFIDGVLEDVTERRKAERERESLINELQTSLLFLNEPVRNSLRPLLTRPLTISIEEAAQAMNEAEYSAIALTADEKTVVGIVTDKDFRSRAMAKGVAGGRPALEIMSAPVASLPDKALVYEALLEMREKGVRHLVVKDDLGNPVGFAMANDLSRFHHYSSAVLINEIRAARTVKEVTESRERLGILVKTLVDSGARPRGVARVITAVSDAVVEKLISLAIEDAGPAPVPFAFIAMGSEGREEQTLITDQDNALLYGKPASGDKDSVASYFKALGERVCRDLAQVGYSYCKGQNMASNVLWRKSLDEWKTTFTKWISEPEAEALLKFSIFFDFRCVFGDVTLVAKLREHIEELLHHHPPFFFHLARYILHYRVPLNLFGQIVTEQSNEKDSSFDLKEATKPIVSYARLYALKHDIDLTNTIDRLQSLSDGKHLHPDSTRALLQAYDFLMQLRYRRQVSPFMGEDGPANTVTPDKLSDLDTTLLKEALNQLSTMQKSVALDYPGANK